MFKLQPLDLRSGSLPSFPTLYRIVRAVRGGERASKSARLVAFMWRCLRGSSKVTPLELHAQTVVSSDEAAGQQRTDSKSQACTE